MNQSYNNYVQHGYGENSHFFVKYGACTQTPLSYREELIRAARLIRNSTEENICVWLSGGADSHITLWAFIAARIPVQVYMMRMEKNLNIHDIASGIIFCEKHQIPYTFLDIDYIEFSRKKYGEIAEKYSSWSPSTCALIHLMGNIDKGCHIFGFNEPKLIKHNITEFNRKVHGYYNTSWKIKEGERVYAMHRYLTSVNKIGAPGFLQYTPELVYSFIQHHLTQELLADKHYPVVNSDKIKQKIYNDASGEIPERKKYHGFEKIFELAPPEWYATRKKASNKAYWSEISTVLNDLIPIKTVSSE